MAKVTDKRQKNRRYRDILANSGLVMEDGEIRDIPNLYVRSYGGELINVNDLNKDPEKQTEEYSVKAQADHGEEIDGYSVPTVEKQFGSCRVWTEDDGLHARVYFANDDALADHLFAISDDASYSIGTEWAEPGYEWDGKVYEDTIGILREISMVITGNDPRARTIDHKAEAKGSEGAAETDGNNKKGNNTMSKTKKDVLTPDERNAMLRKGVEDLTELINDFTTDVPESETEPTARDEAEVEGEKKEDKAEPKEQAATEKKDSNTLHMPINVIRVNDRIRNERASTTNDYLKTDKAVVAWAQSLLESKGDARAWRDNFRKIAKKQDGVDFGDNVSIAPEAVVNAIAEQLHDEDSLLSHVNKTGLAFEVVGIPTSEDGGVGHVRGKEKVEENINGATRVLTPADIYKLMKLDHSMVKLNGGITSSAIVKYVLRELPRKLVETIDKAILVGGVKNDDAAGETAATDFSALVPILTDINTTNSIFATTYTAAAGDNIRATISKAAGRVLSSSDRTLITTPDFFTDLENATVNATSGLLFPNGINKGEPNINGIRRIITPLWLTQAMLGDFNAIVVDLSAYHTVGDTDPENFTDYDIDYNKYVWEVVSCIGGALANKNAAVGIKPATSTASAKTASAK